MKRTRDKSSDAVRVCLLLAAFAGVAPARAAEPVRYEASHDAMGTVFTIVAYGNDATYLAEVSEEAFEEVDRLDAQMSNYRPESELSGISREAGKRAVLVEPRLFDLLRRSLEYSRDTDGAFDITVGPLMRHWGFFRGQGRVPTDAELAEVLRHVGYRHVQLDAKARTVRFDEPGLELDLGGIAKGTAVDAVVAILRENGVKSALVSSGTSTIFALGAPPGEDAWRVTVRDPLRKDVAGDTFRLRDYALSVSGNYEKFFTLDGKTYSHIMDPRTGRPVERMLATAALAPSAEQSDALSTAFYVLGSGGSRRYLATHADLRVVFYVPADSAPGFRRVAEQSRAFSSAAESAAQLTAPLSAP